MRTSILALSKALQASLRLEDMDRHNRCSSETKGVRWQLTFTSHKGGGEAVMGTIHLKIQPCIASARAVPDNFEIIHPERRM